MWLIFPLLVNGEYITLHNVKGLILFIIENLQNPYARAYELEKKKFKDLNIGRGYASNQQDDVINTDELDCNKCLYNESCIFLDDKPQTCYYGVLIKE